MSVAAALALRPGDESELTAITRSSTVEAGLAQRARIVLLAAEGVPNAEIGRLVGMSRPSVILWRKRYEAGGMAWLGDLPRSGGPATVDEMAVVTATLNPPPESFGVTHWSARLLGDQLGISFGQVARIWRKWKLQPWRSETFKFSTDPELESKIRDVVGLYLNPPQNAIVVCIDEKSQIQALNRPAPVLPIRTGIPEKQTHDYVRNGTTTLFAALEIATGKVTQDCRDRHTHADFLAFLKQVAKTYPRRQLHVVCDNYATHKHPAVKAWLAKNKRVTLHFTPTSGSWLNLVEIFFGIITRQAIRRGSFDSVKELVAAIERFIDAWNERCKPFAWTKTPEQILAKAAPKNRQPTSVT